MTNSILTKTAIALATALTIGGSTAALANDIDQSASSAQATREWNQYLNHKTPREVTNGRAAYGFVQGGVHKTSHTR